MKQRVNEAVEDYLRHRRSQKLKVGTTTNDKVTLTAFLRVVPSNIFCENVNGGHMDALFEKLAETRSARTLNNDHFVMCNFFKWCRGSKRMPIGLDPMFGRVPPPFTVDERNRLHVSKFPVLLDAAEHPRDRMLLAAGLYLLARANEITAIRYCDIDFQSRKILVHLSKKRKKGAPGTDLMPITREMKDELHRYINYVQEEQGCLIQPTWFLVPPFYRPRFTNKRDGQFVRGAYDQTLKRTNPAKHWDQGYSQVASAALARIGYPIVDPLTGKSLMEGMHTLRRSGARARYDAIRPYKPDALRQIQLLLHHEHLSQTEAYIGAYVDLEERNEALMDEYMYPQLAPQDDIVYLPAHGELVSA